jgi:hypothetical protein
MTNLEQHKEQGLTLIEVVISIGIGIVLMITLLNLFDWHQKIYTQQVATVRATGAARTILYNMSQDVAQANSVEASHVFGSTTYTSGTNTVVLKLPAVNSSGSVISAVYDYVAYYLSNGKVYQVNDPGTGSIRLRNAKLMGENVQTFALTYNTATPATASIVSIDLQTYIATRLSHVTVHVADTIYLRNQ